LRSDSREHFLRQRSTLRRASSAAAPKQDDRSVFSDHGGFKYDHGIVEAIADAWNGKFLRSAGLLQSSERTSITGAGIA